MKRFIAGNLLTLRVNKTLHGRSVYRPKDVPGHNVIRGYSTPGVGDGLDVFAPAGTPIMSPITGTVTRLMDPGGRLEGCYVTGNGYTVVMAHLNLKDSVHFGGHVDAGQVIGYVGKILNDPHIHIEIWRGDHVLTAKTARGLARLINAEITSHK